MGQIYFVVSDPQMQGALRRLAEVKPERPRLAAIPLTQDASMPTETEVLNSLPADPLPVVGVLSAALCFAGCVLRRYYRQFRAKVRQVNWIPLWRSDSQRSSLTDAEPA